MKIKDALSIAGLIALLVITIPAAPAFGGLEPPIPGSEKIVGPEMWAVGVILCDTLVGTLRVKKIEDCEVDTDPQKVTLTACPTSKTDVLWFRLGQGSVFGICNNHYPIITKVKNFKNEGTVISFDAQIKFVVPNTFVGDVCQP